MESYVVRIYRRAGTRSRILIGTVEVAGSGRKMAFSNVEELWELIKRRKDPRQGPSKQTARAPAASAPEETAEGERKT